MNAQEFNRLSDGAIVKIVADENVGHSYPNGVIGILGEPISWHSTERKFTPVNYPNKGTFVSYFDVVIAKGNIAKREERKQRNMQAMWSRTTVQEPSPYITYYGSISGSIGSTNSSGNTWVSHYLNDPEENVPF